MRNKVKSFGFFTASAGAIGLYFSANQYIPAASLVILSSALFLFGCLVLLAASKRPQDGF